MPFPFIGLLRPTITEGKLVASTYGCDKDSWLESKENSGRSRLDAGGPCWRSRGRIFIFGQGRTGSGESYSGFPGQTGEGPQNSSGGTVRRTSPGGSKAQSNAQRPQTRPLISSSAGPIKIYRPSSCLGSWMRPGSAGFLSSSIRTSCPWMPCRYLAASRSLPVLSHRPVRQPRPSWWTTSRERATPSQTRTAILVFWWPVTCWPSL